MLRIKFGTLNSWKCSTVNVFLFLGNKSICCLWHWCFAALVRGGRKCPNLAQVCVGKVSMCTHKPPRAWIAWQSESQEVTPGLDMLHFRTGGPKLLMSVNPPAAVCWIYKNRTCVCFPSSAGGCGDGWRWMHNKEQASGKGGTEGPSACRAQSNSWSRQVLEENINMLKLRELVIL